MNKFTRLTISILFLFLLTLQESFAQEPKKNYKVDQKVNLKKGSKTPSDQGYSMPIFSHNEGLSYYYNPNKLKEIHKLENERAYHQLLPLLKEYVSHFGSQNFNKDNPMVWKLGRLYEMNGDMETAKFYYRIAIKHERLKSEEMKIRKHYDTVNVNDADSWVPLKHYYELVEYRKAIDTLRPPMGVFINMGDNVNSRFDDYGPALNISGKTLIFTRRQPAGRTMEQKLSEDLYASYSSSENFWDEAQPMRKLNTQYNEGSACISRDGKTVYFARCMSPDGFGDCDIYMSQRDPEDTTWLPPVNMGPRINSRSWDSQPALSHTEDTLYFASDRLGGYGLSDIYYSIKDKETNSWGKPTNVGPIINTSYNEVSPFYHPTYDVLYFSSNGHLLNFGEFDIFKSQLHKGHWTEPRNVGPLVNGPGNEYYFTIDSDSKNLFYARAENEDNTNLDLYSFPLPMEAQPDAYTSFKGTLTDSATNKPFDGIVSMIDLTNGVEIAPRNLRPDGSFEFDLIDDADYLLIIQGNDFFRIEQNIHLDGDTTIHIKTPAVKFKKIQFTSIEFEKDKAKILPEMFADLDKLFNFLVDNPDLKIVISGHTDGNGDPKVNLDLSQRRADAIKAYVTKGGYVSKERVTAIGYGSNKPIIKEEVTDADKKTNRRVEFMIIRPGDDDY